MIRTRRLLILALAIQDAPFILMECNDPDFICFIGDKKVRTLRQAEQNPETGPVLSCRVHGFGSSLVSRSTTEEGTPADTGLSGLVKWSFTDAIDLGFAHLPAFRNFGDTSEAAPSH